MVCPSKLLIQSDLKKNFNPAKGIYIYIFIFQRVYTVVLPFHLKFTLLSCQLDFFSPLEILIQRRAHGTINCSQHFDNQES